VIYLQKKPIFIINAKIGSYLMPFDNPSFPFLGQVALRHTIACVLPFRDYMVILLLC